MPIERSRRICRASLAGAVALGLHCGLARPEVPARPSGAATAPASSSTSIQLLVEPDQGSTSLLDLIASAKSSLWMEIYLLTDDDALAAIAGRATAGCDVRVILEPAPFQDAGGNQGAFAQLAAAGADVRWATPRFAYTHAKAFTVDHAHLAVLTMNLTASGLASNREYVAIDEDPLDVAAAEAIFAADEIGAPAAGPTGRLVTSPERSRQSLTALIAGARTALALETEELTDPGILRALLSARARGVAVTLAWPGPAGGDGSPFAALAAAGAVVRLVTSPTIHGKVAVADDLTTYLGSANLTPTSLDDNREIGLRLGDAAVAARVAATIAADASAGANP